MKNDLASLASLAFGNFRHQNSQKAHERVWKKKRKKKKE